MRKIAVTTCAAPILLLLGCTKQTADDSGSLDALAASLPLANFDSSTSSGTVTPCASDEETAASYLGRLQAAARGETVKLLAYAFKTVRLKDGPGRLGALRFSDSYSSAPGEAGPAYVWTEYFLIGPKCHVTFLKKIEERGD